MPFCSFHNLCFHTFGHPIVVPFRKHLNAHHLATSSIAWDLTLSVYLQIQYFLQRRPSMKTLFVDSYSEMLL